MPFVSPYSVVMSVRKQPLAGNNLAGAITHPLHLVLVLFELSVELCNLFFH